MTERDQSRRLATYLAEHDAECAKCGYNLRGLEGTRCPECGDKVLLRIRLRVAPSGAWVGGMVALVAAVGFHAVFLLDQWGPLSRQTLGPRTAAIRFASGIALVVASLLLAWWLRNRKRLAAMNKPVGASLALGCLGFGMVSVGALLAIAAF